MGFKGTRTPVNQRTAKIKKHVDGTTLIFDLVVEIYSIWYVEKHHVILVERDPKTRKMMKIQKLLLYSALAMMSPITQWYVKMMKKTTVQTVWTRDDVLRLLPPRRLSCSIYLRKAMSSTSLVNCRWSLKAHRKFIWITIRTSLVSPCIIPHRRLHWMTNSILSFLPVMPWYLFQLQDQD